MGRKLQAAKRPEINRLPDWRNRLQSYLDGCKGIVFSWQEHSCLSFSTGAVSAMSGRDHWADNRETLKTMSGRIEVLRYMNRYGGGGLAKAAEMAFSGCVKRQTPGEGDIVLAIVNGAESTGICLGRLCVFVGMDDLVYIKPDEILQVWSIA